MQEMQEAVSIPGVGKISMGMSLSKLREVVMGREAWSAAVNGVAEWDTAEGLDWTDYRSMCLLQAMAVTAAV